jgi:hypothetical protein
VYSGFTEVSSDDQIGVDRASIGEGELIAGVRGSRGNHLASPDNPAPLERVDEHLPQHPAVDLGTTVAPFGLVFVDENMGRLVEHPRRFATDVGLPSELLVEASRLECDLSTVCMDVE